LTEYISFTFK